MNYYNKSVTLTVKVNQGAAPLGKITNYCEIESDTAYKTAIAYTNVGSWEPNSQIIYVDGLSPCAPGTGMSWRFAYRDLQDAFERARAGFGSEIWVAAGTYKPTQNPADTDANFALVNGVPVYGGFAGNETSREQRNWLANQTILTGDINNDSAGDVWCVVTASNVGPATIIDGFTITKGKEVGIDCDGNSPTITHNTIQQNTLYGIGCRNNSSPTVSNNIIRRNSNSGIFCGTISDQSLVRNNTIVHNANYGIYRYSGPAPSISNCIIWSNTTGQLSSGCSASYSCIQNGTTDNNNINTDPCFLNPNDPNDYHLGPNSPCIDRGYPYADYSGETDIDGQGRTVDGDSNGTEIVDMGADEYYYHLGDFNADGIVNFIDYSMIVTDWQSSNSEFSLDEDSDVDYADLAVFCEDWLWQADWWIQPARSMMMGEGMSSQAMAPALVPTVGTAGEASSSSVLAEQPSMLVGEGETAGIWLVYDGNMTPNSGDEITVHIHSDPMLLGMGIIVEVAGDANITAAMCEADCNNYGWDNGWNSDPYIDPNGWLYISGVSWKRVVNGTVGYFKFRYNSGKVTVSVTEESCAFDAYLQPVLFSLEPLIFGRDPNEQ